MQPNSNRPFYIVQPSNITHLNVRPTIITTGGQQIQPQFQQQQQQQQQQHPVYQISTVRQPVMPQQPSTLYQIQQQQPRLITSAPVYSSLQSPRFATSPPAQIVAANTSISPRLITPQTTQRLPMVSPQTTTTVLRPTIATVSTPPTPTPTAAATSAPTPTSVAQPPAPGTKEFAVKVPKTRAQYGIMEFSHGLSIDVKDWKAVEMRREINQYNYRPASSADPNSSSSNTITTSLGVVLPKTGAGSEYGREQKEALKRKRYATKGTNLEDLPWILTDRSSTERRLKHYRGMKKGGVTTNSSYYVFIQGKDGFEAYPVEDWYGFAPTNVYKTLDFEEAEKQYQERHKNLSKWFLNRKTINEKGSGDEIDNDDDKDKKKSGKSKREFKLLEADDWINENDEEEDDDDDDDDNDKSNKKSKSSKKDSKKPKDAWTLSDEDDEDESAKKNAKKTKATKRDTNEEQKEDSDDGDQEGYEVEYTSDESSSDEDDRDANTTEAAAKYEIKGVDEEIKNMPDIEKKLEQMDDNNGEIDFFDDDDEDEEVPDMDDNDDENGKAPGDDFADVGKLLTSDVVSKEMESSSDEDDMEDSDDPDKEPTEPIASSMNNQPVPLEQVKTEKGHKKAREEEMRAIKSKVMSLPTTPANPTETITEEKVRTLLRIKQHMTFHELIQNFLPKLDNQRTKEVKEGIVQKLATVLKRLNIEEKMISGKKHIKLKSS